MNLIHPTTIKKYILPFLLLFILIHLSGCHSFSNSSAITANGFYFDTTVSITLYDTTSREEGERILSECMSLAQHYENLFSRNIPTSDIAQINAHPNHDVTVDKETIQLLQQACKYASFSDGLLDPTIGAVSTLWNFHDDSPHSVPSASQLRTAVSSVNYKNIQIHGQTVRLNDDHASLDLGFIAKGYIADRIKEYLESQSVKSALIRLGGNIVAVGKRPDGTPFRIGIQKPFEATGSTLLTIGAEQCSVVSSGNYERYFIENNTLYHHILSTQTGFPVQSGLSQVTIISESSTDGDAWSTLCYILGYQKAATLLQKHPEIQAIFVSDDGTVSYVNFHSDTLINAPQ